MAQELVQGCSLSDEAFPSRLDEYLGQQQARAAEPIAFRLSEKAAHSRPQFMSGLTRVDEYVGVEGEEY
jgi:hypothetical protein